MCDSLSAAARIQTLLGMESTSSGVQSHLFLLMFLLLLLLLYFKKLYLLIYFYVYEYTVAVLTVVSHHVVVGFELRTFRRAVSALNC